MEQPIRFIWTDDGTMIPASRFWARKCDEQFAVGEFVMLERHEQTSVSSRGHQFAWLREAWESLPDEMFEQFPNAESLRKFALIKKGWCTVKQYPCKSVAEAERWAMNLKPMDPYTLVLSKGDVVTSYTAVSQSQRAMGKKDFQKSKQDIIDFVAALLDVDPQSLSRVEESA